MIRVSAHRIACAVAAHRFAYQDEDDLQAAVHELLTLDGFHARREVRLTPHDRIDLMVERVGIEVKVAGPPATVLRQLRRYAASPEVDELLLVTTMARHVPLRGKVDGKPLQVVGLFGGGL